MAALKVKKGTTICRAGSAMTTISIIISGEVKMIHPTGTFTLTKGNLIGFVDLSTFVYSCDHVASEDTVLNTYSLKSIDDLPKFLTSNEGFCTILFNSTIKQVTSFLDSDVFLQYECQNMYTFLQKSYTEYKALCKQYIMPVKALPDLESLAELELENDISSWTNGYYEDLNKIFLSLVQDAPFVHPNFVTGFMLQSSRDILLILENRGIMIEYQKTLSNLLMNVNHLDFFDLYTGLLFRAMKDGANTSTLPVTIATILIHIENNPNIDKTLYDTRVNDYKRTLAYIEHEIETGVQSSSSSSNSDLQNSLQIILDYADCDDEIAVTFKRLIDEYKQITDKNASDDNLRKLRNEISTLFYQIYTSIFQLSIHDKNIPTIVKMFLLFGYVDEALAGSENAAYLYSIADSYGGNKSQNVYTIYEWLLEIYCGAKEPRRNEFDVDYTGYIREMLQSGKIDKATETRLLADGAQKVLFEIQNMFTTANKMTSGRIINFCPVFSEHCVLSDLDKPLITADKITEVLEQIQSFDYSAFYQDMLFYDASLPIARETVQNKVLPDIILMPNIGNRGAMWQEIEGKNRNSPACFLLPTFSYDELRIILGRVVGEYRWEICRRTQGARWNDVSTPSLTSEYCDYVQFYRKNNELSPDAKEKVKSALAKARNSYKEMFVRDYTIWILFEGTGSPRLNKVARKILLTYCPFPLNVRKVLSVNPIYRELLEKQQIKRSQAEHHIKIVIQKLASSGIPIPEELERQREFLSM